MSRFRFVAACVSVLVGCLVSQVQSACVTQDGPGPTAQVAVRLTDPDGTAIQGIPVSLTDRDSAFVDAITDSAGRAVLPLGSRSPKDGLFVRVGFCSPEHSMSRGLTDPAAVAKRLAELTTKFAFAALYPVKPGESGVSPVEIHAKPSVSVTVGSMLMANGSPGEGQLVSGRNARQSIATWSQGGPKEPLHGLERGAPSTIYALSRSTVIPIDLPASRTTADIELGNISFPAAAARGSLTITVSSSDRLRDGNLRPIMAGVTLVAEDGSRFYRYAGHGDPTAAQVIRATGGLAPPKSEVPPPGKYYLTAGCFVSGRHDAADLREVIRSGRRPEDFGVPLVDIVDGADTTITFDPAKARAAAREAARTLPDDPAN